MSLNRYAQRRDANEGPIIEALERAGASVKQLAQPCDLLVEFRGHLFLLEVKDPAQIPSKRRLTPAQEKFFREFSVTVVLTPEDALRAIGAPVPTPSVYPSTPKEKP